MTHDELENLIYERTRYFVYARYFVYGFVADCILEPIAAEREECAKVCEEQANGRKALELRRTYLLKCCSRLRRSDSGEG